MRYSFLVAVAIAVLSAKDLNAVGAIGIAAGQTERGLAHAGRELGRASDTPDRANSSGAPPSRPSVAAAPSTASGVSSTVAVDRPKEATSGEKNEVEANREHPLGDFSRALFNHAKSFADDLAKQGSESRGLKDRFDEAEGTRNLVESRYKETTGTISLLREVGATPSKDVHLLPEYHWVELAGMYLGLSPKESLLSEHALQTEHGKTAVDFIVRDLSQARIEQDIFALENAGLYVRDERGWPVRQEKWTAPHLHVQSAKPKASLDRFSRPEYYPGTFMNYKSGSESFHLFPPKPL